MTPALYVLVDFVLVMVLIAVTSDDDIDDMMMRSGDEEEKIQVIRGVALRTNIW